MEIKDKLMEIEEKFDSINPNYGSMEELCIYCKSNKYDSIVGIIHDEDCPLFQLRYIIGVLRNG